MFQRVTVIAHHVFLVVSTIMMDHIVFSRIRTINQTCSAGYQCQLLNQLTTCRNPICEKIQNSGLGLSCQSGICKCNSAQFWKSSSSGCTNFYTYGQNTCKADDQCLNNLICRNSSVLACNCYSFRTPTSTGDCNCPAPVIGAEYYYNGSYSVIANSFNQSFTAGYECQSITQLTLL